MSQRGVGVGTMSHNCERNESEWSRCGKKSKRVCENCNITPLLASEVPTENSEISTWFSSDVRKGIVVVIEGRITVDFVHQLVKEFSFLLFSLWFQEGIGIGQVKLPLFGFLTVLGLVGFDWLEEFDVNEFFFWMRGEQQGGGQEVGQKLWGQARALWPGCQRRQKTHW